MMPSIRPLDRLTRPVSGWVVPAGAALVFALSLLVLPLHDGGDLVYYRLFHAYAADAGPRATLAAQDLFTGSQEPLFGLMIWPLAQIAGHDMAQAAINTLLAAMALTLMVRHGATGLIAVLICLNFYVLLVLFPLERLKFAALLLVAALLVPGKIRAVLALASCAVHLQMLAPVAALACAHAAGYWPGGQHDGRRPGQVPHRPAPPTFLWIAAGSIAGIAVVLGGAYLLGDFVSREFQSHGRFDPVNAAKPVIIAGIVIAAVTDRRRAIAAFAPIILAGAIIDKRIAIAAFFVGIVLVVADSGTKNGSLNRRPQQHPLVLILMGYLAVRGLILMTEFVRNGHGSF